MKRKINYSLRSGELLETNSSSSHAVSICMDEKTNLKPGDIDFDLDIRDGVLYVPGMHMEFGWEWQKSNSCQTKLQYVCAFFFNNYQPLRQQKSQKILEKKLKKILGVKKVVFEWVEYYVNNPNEEYLGAPNIDHQSYSDMKSQILENDDTLKNFLLNPKSWFFGGNDNSDPEPGFYDEMYYKDPSLKEKAIVSADFGGDIGVVDFPINYPNEEGESLWYSLGRDDLNSFIDSIVYHDGKFIIKNIDTFSARSEKTEQTDLTYSGILVEDNKMYLCYLNGAAINIMIGNKVSIGNAEFSDFLRDSDLVNERDYLLLPAKLWTEKFGYIYE